MGTAQTDYAARIREIIKRNACSANESEWEKDERDLLELAIAAQERIKELEATVAQLKDQLQGEEMDVADMARTIERLEADGVAVFIAGYDFAARLVRWQHGVGTDQEAYEYLESFKNHDGKCNGETLVQHAAKALESKTQSQ